MSTASRLVIGIGSALLLLMPLSVWYLRRRFRALPEEVVEQVLTLPRVSSIHHAADLELDDGRIFPEVLIAFDRFPTPPSPRRYLRGFRARRVVAAHAPANPVYWYEKRDRVQRRAETDDQARGVQSDRP